MKWLIHENIIFMDMCPCVTFSDPAEVFPALKTFISMFPDKASCGGSIRADLQVLHSHYPVTQTRGVCRE